MLRLHRRGRFVLWWIRHRLRAPMDISLLAFALVFALAFANGANDVSKAIATLVGSGVTDYRSAIAWGTVWTVVGAALAAFVASAMVKTFSHGLVQTGTIIEPAATLAVLTGAMAWVLFAPRTQACLSQRLMHSPEPSSAPASSPSTEKDSSGPRSRTRSPFRCCSVRSSPLPSLCSSTQRSARWRGSGKGPVCA